MIYTRLQNALRKLWFEHVSLTRRYIQAVAANNPSANSIASRLLKNQDYIGDAIKPYYGDSSARLLSQLLREHINIASNLVEAARVGNSGAIVAKYADWLANADKIASVLANINAYWNVGTWRNMLREHLRLTKLELSAELKNDISISANVFASIRANATQMADAMYNGIATQFRATKLIL